MIEKTFEEIINLRGTTDLGALIEIAGQLKRIADAMNKKEVNK